MDQTASTEPIAGPPTILDQSSFGDRSFPRVPSERACECPDEAGVIQGPSACVAASTGVASAHADPLGGPIVWLP